MQIVHSAETHYTYSKNSSHNYAIYSTIKFDNQDFQCQLEENREEKQRKDSAAPDLGYWVLWHEGAPWHLQKLL